MKSLYVVVLLACLSQAFGTLPEVFEFGHDRGEVIVNTHGVILPFQKHVKVRVHERPHESVSYVRVAVTNPLSRPRVQYNELTKTVHINYKATDSSSSTYKVLAKGEYYSN